MSFMRAAGEMRKRDAGDSQRAARSSGVGDAGAAASAAPGEADAFPELLRVTLLYVVQRLLPPCA